MRLGQNPAKRKIPAYEPKRVGIASVVYIPHLDGYYSEALKILRLEVESLRANTSEPIDLLVFDNGSTPLVQQELHAWQQQGLIDWLVLSKPNLGKTGAMNWIFGAMPNEVIGFTDSDVYFRPGWLLESLKRLDSSPLVGAVTAQPCVLDVLNSEEKAVAGLIEEGIAIQEYWPPQSVIREFAQGLGRGEEAVEQLSKTPLRMVELGNDKIKAVLGASHMQFILRRDLARKVIPLPAQFGLSPEEDKTFNQRVDDAGLLHVSLPEPLVVHMGNQLDGSLAVEIERQLASKADSGMLLSGGQTNTAEGKWIERMLRNGARRPWFKRQLTRVYNVLFKILAEPS